MKTKLLLCGLAIGMSTQVMAQEWKMEDTSQRIRPQMFELSPNRYNHHINVALPNDGTLQVDFLRLSDWGEQNRIAFMASTAKTHVSALKDSFKSNYSTKLVAINIPIDEELVSVKYGEDMSQRNQMVWKNGEYYQLKTGFDTIRIIKNIGTRKKPLSDSGLIQMQYTFILKDLSDIQSIASDPILLERIGKDMDSVIFAYRKKWGKQDMRGHYLNVDIDNERAKKTVVKSSNNVKYFFRNHIGASVAFGGTVFRNNVSPYFDISLAYLFPSNTNMHDFIGLSISSFSQFTLNNYDRTYNLTSLEFGVCQKNISLMQKKTSFTVGILTSDYEIKDEMWMSIGVNYGINSYLSVGLNSFISFEDTKNKQEDGFIGVNFKFNL
jgi:transcriptional regulator